MRLEVALTEKMAPMREKLQPKIYQDMMLLEKQRVSDALEINFGCDQVRVNIAGEEHNVQENEEVKKFVHTVAEMAKRDAQLRQQASQLTEAQAKQLQDEYVGELGKPEYKDDGTLERAYLAKLLRACEKFNSERIKGVSEEMIKKRREVVDTDLPKYEQLYDKLAKYRQMTLNIVQSHLIGKLLKVPKSVFENSMKVYMKDTTFHEELGAKDDFDELSKEECLKGFTFIEEEILGIEEKLQNVLQRNQLKQQVVPQFIQIQMSIASDKMFTKFGFEEWTLQMNLKKNDYRAQPAFKAVLDRCNQESLQRAEERGGPAAKLITQQREARIKMQS